MSQNRRSPHRRAISFTSINVLRGIVLPVTDWLSGLYAQSPSPYRARPSQRPVLEVLEDRCLLSGGIEVPGGSNTPLNAIFWNGGQPFTTYGVPGISTPPTVKTITLTNTTTNQTIYPYLRDANTGSDPNNGTNNPNNSNNYYDPQDFNNQEYREYIGYVGADGTQYLGLPAGASITIRVPLVFWDSGRLIVGTDGTYLTNSNPLGINNPFNYNSAAQRGVSLSTDPNSWVTQFTINGTPSTGLVMFYHVNGAQGTITAADPNIGAPAQLTEFTIRDPYLRTGGAASGSSPLGWLADPAETKVIFGYNISNVDALTAPIAMEVDNVPVPIPNNPNPPAPNYGWIGTQLTADSMNTLIYDFVNNQPTASLGQYFGGQGWPSYNIPGGVLKIPGGASIFASSPLNGQKSIYDTYGTLNQWLLSSGGTAPISAGPGAGGSITSSDQTVFTLLFPTNDNGQTRNAFFQNLAQMLGNGKTPNEVDVTVTKDPSTVLGKVVSYNNPSDPNVNPTITATLNGPIPPGDIGPVSFNLVRPVADYAAADITNLWYSWAQYYVKQFANVAPPPDAMGTIAAGTDVLALNSVPSGLAVGMTVSGPGIVAAPGTTVTILSINRTTNQVYLSQNSSAGGSGSYQFGNPQSLPWADPTGIKSITITNPGSGYSSTSPPTVSITSANGSGATAVALVVGGQVTNVVLTNPGSGYNPNVPITVTFSGGGTAAATAAVGTYVTPVFSTLTQSPNAPNLKDFAGSVYEAMNAEAAIPTYTITSPNLPPPMSLVYTAIGCDTLHLPNSDFNGGKSFVASEVTNLIISILDGVPDYTDPNSRQYWYSAPATQTAGLLFNPYNLDPYVWFVHKVLNMSGYGFSVDDASSFVNAQGSNYAPTLTTPNSLQVVYSGIGDVPNPLPWYPSTPYGQVTTTMATVTNQTVNGQTVSILTIPNDLGPNPPLTAGITKFWEVNPSAPGHVGAYVWGQGINPGTYLQSIYSQDNLQFQLSQAAQSTTNPIQVIFTGADTNPLLGSPAPSGSPPPPSNTPPSSPPSLFQQVVTLAQDEFLLFLSQIVARVEVALGIGPDPVLQSTIAAYQSALSADPLNGTSLGQALAGIILADVLNHLTGQVNH